MPNREYQHCSRQACGLTAFFLLIFSQSANSDISIKGITDAAIEQNLRNMLSLRKADCGSPQWMIERLGKRIPDELQSALRPFGYYHATAEYELHFSGECWSLNMLVRPGPPVILKKAQVRIDGEADNDPVFTKSLADIRPYLGERLHHQQYEKIKQTIQRVAQDQGYLDGRFSTQCLQVNVDTNEAEFELIYDSGPRYHFGQISIDQNVLSPEFINRIIQLEPGAAYSSSAIIKLRSSLSNSGYFDKVSVSPDLENRDNYRIPVDIDLTPGKKHNFTAGVGFDTDIGPMLEGSYKNRRLNRSGHSIGASIQLSPVESSVTSNYTIPLARPSQETLSFGLGYLHEDTDSYVSDKYTLTSSLTTILDSGWKQTMYTDFSNEEYEADGEEEKTSLLLMPGIKWSFTTVDNVLRPTIGHMLSLDLNGSHEALLSDVSFGRVQTEAAYIRKISRSGTFIGRTLLGMTLVKDFEDLPTSQRFFAGGARTIRGYQYQELGPTDENGDVFGGRFLVVLRTEYEHHIFDDWALAGFVDTGNAFNENQISFKTGIGTGVHWYSPIGPIRLDIAFPMNESDSSFQIHFATGPRW